MQIPPTSAFSCCPARRHLLTSLAQAFAEELNWQYQITQITLQKKRAAACWGKAGMIRPCFRLTINVSKTNRKFPQTQGRKGRILLERRGLFQEYYGFTAHFQHAHVYVVSEVNLGSQKKKKRTTETGKRKIWGGGEWKKKCFEKGRERKKGAERSKAEHSDCTCLEGGELGLCCKEWCPSSTLLLAMTEVTTSAIWLSGGTVCHRNLPESTSLSDVDRKPV